MSPRAALVALLLCGCVHAAGRNSDAGVPAYLLGEAPPRRFPEAEFLTAARSSTAGPDEAAAAARAAVAAQIRSSITSEFASIESQRIAGDNVRNEATRVRSVLQRATFDRAELIRIVERRRSGGTFYALAALDRAEASQALAADYEASAAPLRALIDEALAHATDARAFTAAWTRARPLARTVASAGAALAVIAGQRPDTLDADLGRLAALEAERSRLLQASAVRLLARGGPAAEAAGVVGRALTSLGLPLVAADEKRRALDLQLDVEESFPRGVGICCAWRLSLRVDGASRPLGVEPMACDLRDRNVAREALLRELGPETLAAPLRAALGSVLPVDE